MRMFIWSISNDPRFEMMQSRCDESGSFYSRCVTEILYSPLRTGEIWNPLVWLWLTSGDWPNTIPSLGLLFVVIYSSALLRNSRRNYIPKLQNWSFYIHQQSHHHYTPVLLTATMLPSLFDRWYTSEHELYFVFSTLLPIILLLDVFG